MGERNHSWVILSPAGNKTLLPDPVRTMPLGRRVRSFLSRRYHPLRSAFEFYRKETVLPAAFPRGHYYSPLPDVHAAAEQAMAAAARSRKEPIPGIDLRADPQDKLLRQICDLAREFDWPERSDGHRRFYLQQGWFNRADSICLYAMLRLLKPARVIEVGSGFSSALMLDVDEQWLGAKTSFTFIDPSPVRLESCLKTDDPKAVQIIPEPVQQVSLTLFGTLQSGDILFIDSSHVSKCGSDVNFLFFEVLPRLNAGVFIHLHDIFWPFEYPASWLRDGFAWNEAYLLRALLLFNREFEVVLWPSFVGCETCSDCVASGASTDLSGSASFWMRRAQ